MDKEFNWIKENEDGTYSVETKIGTINLIERSGDEVEKAFALSDKSNKDPAAILLMKSIADKEKYPDQEIAQMPGSVYIKLKLAVSKIYGLTDFL